MSKGLEWFQEHNGVWVARSGGVTRARVVDDERGHWVWAVYDGGWTVDVGQERIAKAAQDAVVAALAKLDARAQAAAS